MRVIKTQEIKMVRITSVIPDSIAHLAGIEREDILVSINGFEINDVLDYQFYCTEKKLKIVNYSKNVK